MQHLAVDDQVEARVIERQVVDGPLDDPIQAGRCEPDHLRGEVEADGLAHPVLEGIATRVSFDLPFSIYKQYLDDFVLLTEEELADGVRMALKTTHNLPEGAGSASIAAAYKLRHTLAEQRVVCIMSGGNIDAAKLKWILAT